MLTKARSSELSPPPPLCPCLCCLWYKTGREKESGRKQNSSSVSLSFSDEEGEGRINALRIFNSAYLHSWQVTDGCVCECRCNNWQGKKRSLEKSDRQQFLTRHCKFKTYCIYAPFVGQNQCDDATTFLASISICRAACKAALIDDTWLDWWKCHLHFCRPFVVLSARLWIFFPFLKQQQRQRDRLITVFAMQRHCLEEFSCEWGRSLPGKSAKLSCLGNTKWYKKHLYQPAGWFRALDAR